MPIRRHVGTKQVGRTTATAFLLNSTYQVLKSRPRNFLGLNHDGPQRVYHFVELFLRKKRSSRTLSINCGSRVVLGLKWFECLLVKTSSFPCAKDSEPNHVTVFLACKEGLGVSSRFPVPAERCSRKRVCHTLLLPGAVAGELSKPKTPSQQKRHDNYTPVFLAVVFKLQF